MGICLKIFLGIIFSTISIILFIYSEKAEYYIKIRYNGIQKLLAEIIFTLPENIFNNVPRIFYIILSAIMAFGSIGIILEIKKVIIVYAYLILVIGGIIHVPYDTSVFIEQLRKLIFTFAIFFCLLIAAHTKTELPNLNKKSNDENGKKLNDNSSNNMK